MVYVGEELFRDDVASKFGGVIIGDLMDGSSQEQVKASLGGRKAQVAYVGKVFHLYDWESQLKLVDELVALMDTAPAAAEKKNVPTVIFGEQLGVERDDHAGPQPMGFKGAA